MVESLDQVDSTPIKKKAKKNKRASNKEIFMEILSKITTNIITYTNSERIEEWITNFDIGLDYEQLSINQIKYVHESLSQIVFTH